MNKGGRAIEALNIIPPKPSITSKQENSIKCFGGNKLGVLPIRCYTRPTPKTKSPTPETWKNMTLNPTHEEVPGWIRRIMYVQKQHLIPLKIKIEIFFFSTLTLYFENKNAIQSWWVSNTNKYSIWDMNKNHWLTTNWLPPKIMKRQSRYLKHWTSSSICYLGVYIANSCIEIEVSKLTASWCRRIDMSKEMIDVWTEAMWCTPTEHNSVTCEREEIGQIMLVPFFKFASQSLTVSS